MDLNQAVAQTALLGVLVVVPHVSKAARMVVVVVAQAALTSSFFTDRLLVMRCLS